MTAEHTAEHIAAQTIAANALLAWRQQLEFAQKVFAPLSGEQLHKAIAPGKNRLIYLYGHLVAVHDRMLPLLGIGPRLHPQLDAPFLAEKDRAVADADLPSAADQIAPNALAWTYHDSIPEAGYAARARENPSSPLDSCVPSPTA